MRDHQLFRIEIYHNGAVRGVHVRGEEEIPDVQGVPE